MSDDLSGADKVSDEGPSGEGITTRGAEPSVTRYNSGQAPTPPAQSKVLGGDSVHWYDKDGAPVWSITGKNGKQRSPYTKEAIAAGYVPGVTTITKQVWSFGLQNYFLEQGIWSALTLLMMPEEKAEDYVERVKLDSKQHARARADEGTELHKAIDQYVLGQPYDTRWHEHILTLATAMRLHGYELEKGKPQVTFATAQYGGTADLVFPDAVWDWKTKPELDGKKKLAYDDHGMQLTAYDRGILDEHSGIYNVNGRLGRKLFNVFVGCKDGAVQVHEWDDPKDIKRCWLKFQHLLGHWWADNQP